MYISFTLFVAFYWRCLFGDFCVSSKTAFVKTTFEPCRNSRSELVTPPYDCALSYLPNPEVAVVVFVHVAVVSGLDPVLVDELLALEESGLYAEAESVTITVVGEIKHVQEVLSSFPKVRFSKVRTVQVSSDPSLFEKPSINFIQRYAENQSLIGTEKHVLYMHTKGVYAETGASIPKWYWRHVMQFWLLDHHEYARSLLSLGYDAVGVNAVHGHLKKEALFQGNDVHYSGNFWWASTDYLSKLEQITDAKPDFFSRCQAENWILSGTPDICAGVLYHWGGAHIYDYSEIPNLNVMKHTSPDCRVIDHHKT